jgi:hypothetical protein
MERPLQEHSYELCTFNDRAEAYTVVSMTGAAWVSWKRNLNLSPCFRAGVTAVVHRAETSRRTSTRYSRVLAHCLPSLRLIASGCRPVAPGLGTAVKLFQITFTVFDQCAVPTPSSGTHQAYQGRLVGRTPWRKPCSMWTAGCFESMPSEILMLPPTISGC